jgi:hypothetical protein
MPKDELPGGIEGCPVNQNIKDPKLKKMYDGLLEYFKESIEIPKYQYPELKYKEKLKDVKYKPNNKDWSYNTVNDWASMYDGDFVDPVSPEPTPATPGVIVESQPIGVVVDSGLNSVAVQLNPYSTANPSDYITTITDNTNFVSNPSTTDNPEWTYTTTNGTGNIGITKDFSTSLRDAETMADLGRLVNRVKLNIMSIVNKKSVIQSHAYAYLPEKTNEINYKKPTKPVIHEIRASNISSENISIEKIADEIIKQENRIFTNCLNKSANTNNTHKIDQINRSIIDNIFNSLGGETLMFDAKYPTIICNTYLETTNIYNNANWVYVDSCPENVMFILKNRTANHTTDGIELVINSKGECVAIEKIYNLTAQPHYAKVIMEKYEMIERKVNL